MKTLTKQQKNQRQNNKQKQKLNQVQSKSKASAATLVEQEDTPEQLSAYDSYYKQLSEEVETVGRHVRELRQTPGLEHLTEAEAHAKVDFMLRFSVWVFNQHLQEHTVEEVDNIEYEVNKVSKVQKPKGQSNKK